MSESGQHDEQLAADEQPAASEQPNYPPGFEPELEGKALQVAITKEKGYRWLVRFQLLAMLGFVALIIYFICTS